MRHYRKIHIAAVAVMCLMVVAGINFAVKFQILRDVFAAVNTMADIVLMAFLVILFAFLIDKAGAVCSSADIIHALFYDSVDSYYRVAKKDLEKALTAVGAEAVLIKEWSKLGVAREQVFCDYYEYLKGNPSTVNFYKGVYMSQYDWAKNSLKKSNG